MGGVGLAVYFDAGKTIVRLQTINGRQVTPTGRELSLRRLVLRAVQHLLREPRHLGPALTRMVLRMLTNGHKPGHSGRLPTIAWSGTYCPNRYGSAAVSQNSKSDCQRQHDEKKSFSFHFFSFWKCAIFQIQVQKALFRLVFEMWEIIT